RRGAGRRGAGRRGAGRRGAGRGAGPGRRGAGRRAGRGAGGRLRTGPSRRHPASKLGDVEVCQPHRSDVWRLLEGLPGQGAGRAAHADVPGSRQLPRASRQQPGVAVKSPE
ncbi:hypothetical protein DIPPA_00140, partial [Diplonema papillatum]